MTHKEELRSFYFEKVAQLQFQVLKMRRTLAKRELQEQKWLEDSAVYQQRIQEGEAALNVLSESNPHYHKIRLDIQKCKIKIMELEIRLKRFTLVQKAEKITKIMALEASISYYQRLIMDLEAATSVQKPQNFSRLLVDKPLGLGLFSPNLELVGLKMIQCSDISFSTHSQKITVEEDNRVLAEVY
jgi:hypothetical protein